MVLYSLKLPKISLQNIVHCNLFYIATLNYKIPMIRLKLIIKVMRIRLLTPLHF